MKNNKNEFLMSGNEALARGALESGVGFCASYPGTPSTEITETLIRTGIAHVEWSTNEKVALEACAGASWAGIRALCPMKSLGLNVASDFLLNLNLTGTGPGGLVIVVCDDPMGHSSSNEQDSRFYAKAAKVPLFEPSTYQEAKDVIPFAFQISADFEVPVIVRSTTRLSHSRGLVSIEEPKAPRTTAKPLPPGLFNVPRPTEKHRDLLAKLELIADLYSESGWNEIEEDGAASTLVISSGISRRYVEEAIRVLDSDEFVVLRIVTSYPLPYKTITDAITRYDRVVFVEENDPFIEDEVRALSTTVDANPKMFGVRTGETKPGGEMTTDRAKGILAAAVGLKETVGERPSPDPRLLSERPLTFCAGCTHRNFYYAVKRVKKRLKGKIAVAGDIGCYSLGVFYDEAMDTMQAMGSGIGVASGLGQLGQFGFEQRVLAVSGDSTFFHACIPALVNCRHKNANVTFVILDNETTAMTGFQPHPGSKESNAGYTKVDIARIVEAIQPDHFERGNAEDLDALVDRLHTVVKRDGVNVMLLDSICRLEEARRVSMKEVEVHVDSEKCRGERCRICVQEFSCPAITWDYSSGKASILERQCVACGACIVVCPHDAIQEGRK